MAALFNQEIREAQADTGYSGDDQSLYRKRRSQGDLLDHNPICRPPPKRIRDLAQWQGASAVRARRRYVIVRAGADPGNAARFFAGIGAARVYLVGGLEPFDQLNDARRIRESPEIFLDKKT